MKKTLVVMSVLLLLAMFLATTQSFVAAASVEKKSTEVPGNKGSGNDMKGTESPGKGSMEQVGKKYHFRGIIAAASAQSITLTLENNSTMTFSMSSKVQIKVPTLAKTATVADLVIGLQATVQAEKKTTGYEARMIIVVPGKPSTGHHVGVVTAYVAGTSITIVDQKGTSTTFKLTAETQIVLADPSLTLKVGSRVTVVAPRNPASVVQTARAVVVHLDQPSALKQTPTVTK